MKLREYIVQLIIIFNLKIMGIINPKYNERAKRMLFLTSLAIHLAREGIIKNNVLDSLNEESSPEVKHNTFVISDHLSKCIWQKTTLLKALSIDDCRNDNDVMELINETAPLWIKYDPALMKDDVKDLLNKSFV